MRVFPTCSDIAHQRRATSTSTVEIVASIDRKQCKIFAVRRSRASVDAQRSPEGSDGLIRLDPRYRADAGLGDRVKRAQEQGVYNANKMLSVAQVAFRNRKAWARLLDWPRDGSAIILCENFWFLTMSSGSSLVLDPISPFIQHLVQYDLYSSAKLVHHYEELYVQRFLTADAEVEGQRTT